jgi:hypothetical protein
MSSVWVTDPGRIIATDAMSSAWGVSTITVPVCGISAGTDAIVGRVPLNRYGGEKISAVRKSAAGLSRPPPATSTRPSGRSKAVE